MIDDWRRALEQQSVHFEQWSGTLSQLDVVLRSHVDFLERQEQRAAEAHEELLTTLRALRSDSRRRERDDGNGHGYGEEWGNDDDFGVYLLSTRLPCTSSRRPPTPLLLPG
ncbi:hypothetical protein PFISCL1PPCAC_28686 [Pristionchus fissidentatus]|nr:hypothetical protein PFISCL1PPCAC_3568 [Pristionchus fissidentatus]GMT21084.1 hypothetical protein PFISCL1PPCAC_12381 [Pristionchus fissidentatus]GMT37389.1 hypothetical protein PFISCL1PPCAC_28686 [Pristionchus fissidentatus]